MQTINIAKGPENVSRLVLGCMRMPALKVEDAAKMIQAAYDLGINYIDHATCYGDGEAETRFGEAIKLTNVKREDLIIQSKCGLRFDKQIFDWRKSNILESVDGILERLQMDYIDVLLTPKHLTLPDFSSSSKASAISSGSYSKSGLCNSNTSI